MTSYAVRGKCQLMQRATGFYVVVAEALLSLVELIVGHAIAQDTAVATFNRPVMARASLRRKQNMPRIEVYSNASA
jgi:hypothetical protein